MDKETILKEIDRRMQRHPGDAPWSCIECYKGQPCVEKEILEAAKKQLGN